MCSLDRAESSEQDSILTTQCALTMEIDRHIQVYESLKPADNYDNNPLTFWNQQARALDTLTKIAGSVFVIPASFAESERHSFVAGQIVNEQRSAFDPEWVEALAVLKKADIKRMQPTLEMTMAPGLFSF